MKNYKELETKCKSFAELQEDLKGLITGYVNQKEYYRDDPEYAYDIEQRNILTTKISIIENLLEHLDKLF